MWGRLITNLVWRDFVCIYVTDMLRNVLLRHILVVKLWFHINKRFAKMSCKPILLTCWNQSFFGWCSRVRAYVWQCIYYHTLPWRELLARMVFIPTTRVFVREWETQVHVLLGWVGRSMASVGQFDCPLQGCSPFSVHCFCLVLSNLPSWGQAILK